MILLGLAIAPGVAIAVYVYFKDKYEKEPLSLLIKCFAAGFISVLPAGLTELLLFDLFPLSKTSLPAIAVHNFLFIGFTEELYKFLPLYAIAYKKPDFNEPFDGITYAVMVSMGFATAENIMYVSDGGVEVGIMRMFTAVPAHASFSVLMGFFVGLAKFKKHQRPLMAYGVGTATLFHGAYDFFLSIDDIELIALGALVSLVTGVYLSMKAMKMLSEHSPFRYAVIVHGQQMKGPE